VGFEPTIPVFERAKTVNDFDREVTLIGRGFNICHHSAIQRIVTMAYFFKQFNPSFLKAKELFGAYFIMRCTAYMVAVCWLHTFLTTHCLTRHHCYIVCCLDTSKLLGFLRVQAALCNYAGHNAGCGMHRMTDTSMNTKHGASVSLQFTHRT
jgi:hypothetical protein